MSVLALLAEDPARTHHWLLPETPEIIYGGLASLLIFGLLYKFAGPMVKKAMAARTLRIQGQLDDAANDRTSADAEAAQIRTAAGDIEAERSRLLADADTAAEQLLTDGRARLQQELIELEARADAELASIASRTSDEMRAEIARLANVATDRVLSDGLVDDALQQQLIESFIQKVGASS
jgi:F-type H+-transporting ATPase subunit b